MDKSCTIITINQPEYNSFELTMHCDTETAIKAAALIVSHVINITGTSNHEIELILRVLQEYIYSGIDAVRTVNDK